jgi:hypothetical protein
MSVAAETRYALNKMNDSARKYQLGSLLNNSKNMIKCQYNFSTQGGAIGSINLLDEDGLPVTIPKNFIITRVIVDVLTAPTSSGAATVALKSKNAADLLAATAIASVTGIMNGVPQGSAGTAIKMTADTIPQITIAAFCADGWEN